MKDILKKTISRSILLIIVGLFIPIVVITILNYLSLLTSNPTLNLILSGLLGIYSGLVILFYLDGEITSINKKQEIELTEEQQEKIINNITEKGLYHKPIRKKINKEK